MTGSAGVVALAELVDRLGVVAALDGGIGPVKSRRRGLSAGELLIGMARSQLLGGDALVALDRQRADQAAGLLSAVPVPAASTAAGLARRFGAEQLAGVEAGVAALTARVYGLLPPARRAALAAEATIDLDSTDVEVYGRLKRGVAYNYQGQRAGRPLLATWAQAGLTLAAELLAGNQDVRPRAAAMLRRALAALPEGVAGPPRVRADSGFFTAELAHAAVQAGCDYAVAAKRSTATWRALAAIPAEDWRPAADMPGAEVAACDHAPGGWPADTYTIVRRVRVEAAELSADPRSRRRRTIDPNQLALALDGELQAAWAVSFIVTNIPCHGPDDPVGIEAWFRHRTDVEERIREAKLGAALRHLPSGHEEINRVWMWAALLAGNLSVWLQALTGLDTAGRAHAARLRRQLLTVPARVIRHARGLTLRLPPGPQLLPEVHARLRALPRPA